MKKGIMVAGQLCVDNIYPVGDYPPEGQLVNILEGAHQATGGLICNTIMDLARLAPDMPLYACGYAGHDPDGEFVMERLRAFPNVNTDTMIRSGRTGYTLVISNSESKNRTFFTYGGANASFDENSIDLDNFPADILHVGYILVLPTLDEPDPEFGTRMARLLHSAQARGIRTSIDVVSETGNRARRTVPPALRYCDFCVINELEAGSATGLTLRREDGTLDRTMLRPALEALRAYGVRQWTVIHAPECAAGIDENGSYVELDSLKLPAGFIQGTTGAGDAFCAGVLIGAENDAPLEEAIRLGICSAAASLSAPDTNSGVRPAEEVLKLWELYH